jgi:hypothetical protein
MGRGAALAALATLAALAPSASAQQPSITLSASAQRVRSGATVTLSGQATDAPPASQVILNQAPYPYTTPTQVGIATPDVNGNFSFSVTPVLNTEYRVQLAGTSAQASVRVGVTDNLVVKTKALSLGRVEIRVLVSHPSELRWFRRPVKWWIAEGFSRGHFAAEPTTRTRALSSTLTELSTTMFIPDAGEFRWRACFEARDDQALVDLKQPPGCKGRGYHGFAHAPFGYPSKGAIQHAEAYLNGTGGHTALAVVTSEGREYGDRVHDRFITGSVVKSMLLVAYLRRLDAMGQHYVDANSNAILYPMINVSDNNAASAAGAIVGNSGLYDVAHAAGMVDFSVTTDWGSAFLSANDMAKFFFEMDSLIPKEFVGYARNLLSTIAGFESWGIPAVARPLGWTVFFKGGWRPSPDIYLVHQIARLEGHGVTFAMAVMTDGDNGMGDGISKIQGTTAALLSTPPPKPRHLDPRALLNG